MIPTQSAGNLNALLEFFSKAWVSGFSCWVPASYLASRSVALADSRAHAVPIFPWLLLLNRWNELELERFALKRLVIDIYKYRQLIWVLALKELKVRYKRSVLGFTWALLNPALTMLVLTLVFSTILRFGIPHYSIFLLSVLLPWTFFSQSLSYAVESIVGNGELIKKISVPKLVFPVAAVVSNVINLLLSFIPLALIVIGMRHPFYATWLYLPVPMLALIIFTLGMTFFFAAANVYYRDVAHIVQVVLSAWFYLTPIIYALDFIPPNRQWLF